MKFLLAFAFLGACFGAQANDTLTLQNEFKGFVTIESGRELYVDWIKAQDGQPTVVVLNGLTYDTTYWNAMVKSMVPSGVGIFRYDPFGMGKTLEHAGAVQDVIRIEDQARDLDLLTKAVGLTGKLDLMGLSYGGGLAIAFARDYSDRIEKAILMCPYTEPLAQQDAYIQGEIAMTRITFPLNPATDDELYAFFLRQNVYYVYPLTEPSMYDSPLKPEAVFQMTQGIRKFDMYGAAQHFPPHSVHLIIAGADQYIPRPTLEKFWAALPMDSRASKTVVDLSEHKIPEAYPAFAAKWVDLILQNASGIDAGSSYEVNPVTEVITKQ